MPASLKAGCQKPEVTIEEFRIECKGGFDSDGGPVYWMIRGSCALQVTMPCFLLWTKHQEIVEGDVAE